MNTWFCRLILVSLLPFGLAFPSDYKNKLRIGTDERLVYQRQIADWFHIGTNIKYSFTAVGDEPLHFDHHATYWLLTLGKSFEWEGIRFDNTVKYFGDVKILEQVGYEFAVRKEVAIRDNILLLPSIDLVDYVFDMNPDPSKYPGREWRHNLFVSAGISLNFEYLF
jgi:hypothetical protein